MQHTDFILASKNSLHLEKCDLGARVTEGSFALQQKLRIVSKADIDFI